MSRDLRVLSKSEEATRAVGRALGRALSPGRGKTALPVVLLYGGLGAGKTVLVRGVGDALGVGNRVRSPSFTLVNEYSTGSGLLIAHADLYRIEEPGEVDALGLEEYILSPDTVLFVEWPERLTEPPDTGVLKVTFRALDEVSREITFHPAGGAAEEAVASLRLDIGDGVCLNGEKEVSADE